ncbi:MULTISPECIES: Fic family protein [Lacticaseibacillus]|uniref:Fido domain-containing protein n=1 Tax=Lacticaseibacillus casei DSM 20011 = JCM 1134 = ATCC 393 TaxID=1423732 RepID=A0AAD1AMQ4_LACCA|nr:Fic family protein [Lacticaseibacillus casei]MBI6597614.1 Fic family protein [Lacticaseibacillus casei]MBO1481274.1 Fic family protein [Lacticaseibacillus casei]MBO2416554.1 Fic family protein [Lacticaseibacillus casei]MCK2080993.1 Fic family protein [Lacticaseibacillus casei]MDZ5495479.1 Fic family protein [Lacticaseibacillus casei]
MSYLPLSKFKYNNNGTGRKSPQEIDAEYRLRLSGPSTVKTTLFPVLENPALLDLAAAENKAISVSKYPIFFVETHDINLLVSRIQSHSATIVSLANHQQLPPVAIRSYLKKLLSNEIIFTNEIEGVQTNPKEIGTIIGNLQQKPGRVEKRLESTIRKYHDSATGRMKQINGLKDYRDIYDELLKGEIPEAKLPDGKLFRNKFAFIGTDAHAVHIPPVTENEIEVALEQLIIFMNSDDLLTLEKAVITHFMFENTHPFLDGNGRTGRYLLSSYLSSKLDPFTGLSVSTAIHNNLSTYYRLFQEADNIENRAELTFFLKGMLKIIESGQTDVINELESSKEQLQSTSKKLYAKFTDLDDVMKEVLYVLLQSYLFTESITYGIQDRDIVEVLKRTPNSIPRTRTKRAIDMLESKKMITSVSKNPLQHVISKEVLDKILPSK